MQCFLYLKNVGHILLRGWYYLLFTGIRLLVNNLSPKIWRCSLRIKSNKHTVPHCKPRASYLYFVDDDEKANVNKISLEMTWIGFFSLSKTLFSVVNSKNLSPNVYQHTWSWLIWRIRFCHTRKLADSFLKDFFFRRRNEIGSKTWYHWSRRIFPPSDSLLVHCTITFALQVH